MRDLATERLLAVGVRRRSERCFDGIEQVIQFLRWNCLLVAGALRVDHEIDRRDPDDRLAVGVGLCALAGLHLEERWPRFRRDLLWHSPSARDGGEFRAEGGLERSKERRVDLFAGNVHLERTSCLSECRVRQTLFLGVYTSITLTRTETKTVIIGTLVALLVGLVIVFFPKFQYVDQRQAIAVGDGYFSRLKQGEVDDAFAMYTDGFIEKVGEKWREVIRQLQQQGGGILDFRFLRSRVVPFVVNKSSTVPCVFVQYKVTREKLSSEDGLIICPHQRGEAWAIAGHEIIRKDTGQRLSAGLTFQEKTIIQVPHSSSK